VELLEQRLETGAGRSKATITHARELRAGWPPRTSSATWAAWYERLGKLVEAAQAHTVERAAERAAAASVPPRPKGDPRRRGRGVGGQGRQLEGLGRSN